MPVDRLFVKKQANASFTFNREVSEVFDNMVRRSVPFYEEVNRLSIETITTLVRSRGRVIDLGCSTGHFLRELALKKMSKKYHLIGIDNSISMLEQAKKNSEKLYPKPQIDFVAEDILNYPMPPCDAVVLNYALQFIKKNKRHNLLKTIFKNLRPKGFLILSEKITLANPELEFHHLYYKKKNGYSNLEISRKRDSLENVLIPNTLNTNLEMLRKSGFKKIDILFQWINFSTLLARKDA